MSWNDCQEFLKTVNEKDADLSLRLPLEAQWEHACRAGSQGALYGITGYANGTIVINGANNAPALDPVAWYGGNSGLDFELKIGYVASDWKEKQYEFSKADTHPVKRKLPNRWGLYDMLGNVFEWCEDRYGDYPAEPVTDPKGPGDGEDRVLRGGGWDGSARNCRSACRSGYEPGNRDSVFGVRLSRGQ